MSIGKRIGAFISGISRPGTTDTSTSPASGATYAPERDGVRREGAALDETIFTAVVEARRGLSR